LQREGVGQVAVVAVRPNHDAGVGVGQVRGDAHLVFVATDGAVEDVGGAERLGRAWFVAAAEGEARSRADHLESGHPRHRVEDLLRDAIGQRARGAVAPGAVEGQHREDGRDRRACGGAGVQREHAQRLAHLSELDLAARRKARRQFRRYAVTHYAGDDHAARRRFGLQARGDVDPVS